jgi:hypothetical protein
MQLAQQYRGNGHFLSAAPSSRHEAMVGSALSRDLTLRVGLGVSGDRYHRVWIVYSPIGFVDFSFVDIIFISKYF